MTTAIEVQDLTVRYGDVVALAETNVTVQAGRVCGLVGMNGSGKSTLFKSMMGLTRPDTGEVRLAGRTPMMARKAGVVGYVPQHEDVDWAFPIDVGQVVMTGRYGYMGPLRRARRSDRAAVADALDRVGLVDLAHRQIGQLSGGQKKRAFVARGIAQGATILLLDEPFAGVDKRSEGTIIQLLRDLAAEGVTVLVSTHDLHGLPDLVDEAVLINGTVLMHGSPHEVLQPQNLSRAFGLDPTNPDGPTNADEPATEQDVIRPGAAGIEVVS